MALVRNLRTALPARGFTLIEIIVAIVVMSIMAIGLVEFITTSASGYALSAARNQVSASGRVVIDRVSMELHNALPQSIRISAPHPGPDDADGVAGDQCLEFIPVRAATTYLDPVFRPAAAAASAFNVVNFVPAQAPVANVYAVIYPVSAAELYVETPTDTEAIVEVSVTDVDGLDNTNEITPLAAHRFKRRSAVDRLFLTDQPVSYCVSGTKLYRYSGYGFHDVQLKPLMTDGVSCAAATCLPASTLAGRVLVTDQLDNSALIGGLAGQAFDQLEASRRRNAVIQLEFNFSQDGQQVRLNHEVLQQSTP